MVIFSHLIFIGLLSTLSLSSDLLNTPNSDTHSRTSATFTVSRNPASKPSAPIVNKKKVKEISIKKVSATNIKAIQVPEMMDREGLSFVPIDNVNWDEYPYCPKAEFRIAHTGDHILLHYRVTEKSVRALAAHDMGRVWEDACCEFFIQPGKKPVFYNFECDCIGTLLLHCGKVGKRQEAPEAIAEQVQRWSSLGSEPFEERIGECSWELALVIPTTVLFKHKIKDISGMTCKGNFYKCGDKLQNPHFISWSPIDLPKPMFHCPEFFGLLHFED